jgi:hypothetical protein
MNEDLRHALLLDHGAMLRVDDGCGVLIRVSEGKVWITQDGDLRDVTLRAGEQWRISREGATLVQALCPSRLSLVAERRRERRDTRATFSLALADPPPLAHDSAIADDQKKAPRSRLLQPVSG